VGRGETPRGKYMGIILKAAEQARREGRDPNEAIARERVVLEEEMRRSAKRDLRLWSPALYRPGADKRGSENVTHVGCRVLDYDDGTSIADASATWSTWFHIVHTTWSHTADFPKFRIIMPLAFAVASEDWAKVWSWAEEIARFEIDPTMKSPAATYALPAVPHRAWPREAFSRPGAILDPVDEGILERRTQLDLAPKRPPEGVPSMMRGEDPEHEYLDHEDPDAVYFVDEAWEDDWDASPELVAAAKGERVEAQSGEWVADTGSESETDSSDGDELSLSEGPQGRRTDSESDLDSDVADALEQLVDSMREGKIAKAELAEAARRLLLDEHVEPRRVGPGRHRRTLAIDFDGVIHAYTSGWRGATVISDPPVEGAIDWLLQAAERFDLAIFSARASHPGAIDAMRAWLTQHGLPARVLERIRFPRGKPPAELYIDDRAYRFEGAFPSWSDLDALEPWTKKRAR
jgi:hypothetical protein